MTTISPALCRAARALLGLSQSELSETSGVHRNTLSGYEADEGRELIPANLAAVQAALEKAGVTFLDAEGGRGPGVAFAKPPRKARSR